MLKTDRLIETVAETATFLDSNALTCPIPFMEEKILVRLTPRQQNALHIARRAAEKVIHRRFRLLSLVRSGYRKLAGNRNALEKVQADLFTFLRLIKAWARNEYRDIPWKSFLYIVAAVVYFISPIDLIPDALAVIGFADDIAVITAVVHAIQGDLDRFRNWEDARL